MVKTGLHIVSLMLLMLMTGCSKEIEILDVDNVHRYFPLSVGKTSFYRLDSTVTSAFGTSLVTKKFLAKDSVESTFYDNEGRLSFRIFRFITDTLGKQPWRFAATYVATPTVNAIEYVDNNYRFIKLHAPVSEGFQWKAHSFIDTKSLNSAVRYLDEWQYEYNKVGEPFSVFSKEYTNTISIAQNDETTPQGPFNPQNYQQRNLGIEVYADGIGLIYKEFLHWTWQVTPPPARYEDGSYGITLRLINYR